MDVIEDIEINPVANLFKINLSRLMDMYGISNAEMARSLDVSREIVGQWRMGKYHPLPDKIAKIAEILKCQVDELLCPYYLTHLRNLMKKHQINPITMALVLDHDVADINGWMSGVVEPSIADKQKICEFFEINSLDEPPNLIPLKKWAKQFNIPLKKANDMVSSNLLECEYSPFGMLIKSDMAPPDYNKKLIWLSRQISMDDLKNFPFNLSNRMMEKNLGDEAVASVLGVHPGTVSHWRSGNRMPNKINMTMLAELCECDVEDFFKPLSNDLPIALTEWEWVA